VEHVPLPGGPLVEGPDGEQPLGLRPERQRVAVSRYEAGRITPSAEALVRLAETLNISIDHLLIDTVPRRPLHAAEYALGDRLAAVAELPPDDIASLLNVIDGLVAKNRLKTLAGGLS
jgi:transcriptional regulator with XRE-family HTH domain